MVGDKNSDITKRWIGKYIGYGLNKLPWLNTLEAIRNLNQTTVPLDSDPGKGQEQ